MRALFVRLHRWFGLTAAVFLFVVGATGAVISWDHELDAWLNPQLFEARSAGSPLPVAELVRRAEAADPRAWVRYHALAVEPEHTFLVYMEPRVDPSTGQPHALDYNQVALDPVTGQVQARRFWGAISLSRENLLPFLYKLHYSMHLPERGGIEWGVWLMGLIAVAWVLDTLIALWISFPQPSQWRRSFTFRWSAGGHRRVFDLHRSGGVWLFALVLMLAVTSVAMNLNTQVMRPVVSWFSTLTPSPFASRTPLAPAQAPEPRVDRWTVVAQAQAEAWRRGWSDPPGAVFLAKDYGVWGVGFFQPGLDHGDGGLGNPWLYYDSQTGAPVGADIPGTGTAGDIFLQSMFPLHSGRILGLSGRLLISLMGLAIATLSVTGVLIWARKQRGRGQGARTRNTVPLASRPRVAQNEPLPRPRRTP